MKLILYELVAGAHAQVCTLGSEANSAFEQFLDEIGPEREEALIALMDRLCLEGTIENPTMYGSVSNAVGLFRAYAARAEIVFFRHGKRMIICGHTKGKLSRAEIERAKWAQTSFLNNYIKQPKIAS